LRSQDGNVSLLDHPSVQFIKQRIAEVRVPREVLGSTGPRDFELAVNGRLLPARILIEDFV
jgi:hypothetical protein